MAATFLRQLHRERFKLQVSRLAISTADAYSFDNYTESGWRSSIAKLARRGYSAHAIEEIMRSKWTRWAADVCEGHRYGSHSSACLMKYLDSHGTAPSNWQQRMFAGPNSSYHLWDGAR